jgi:hypothetical protein
VKILLLTLLFSIFNGAHAHIVSADGGISGGGGNVISPKTPRRLQDPVAVRVDILASRGILKEFIQIKLNLLHSGNMQEEDKKIYSVLFQETSHGILETIDELPIHIPVDAPCYDLQGNEYDGIAINSNIHTVCISAYNLAQKVDRSEVYTQAAALMLHELAEVAGLEDDDAIYLQNQLIKEFRP